MKSSTRRKVLAVLAAGAVLGVGTAATLAAWNDSEFATGTFTAGSFSLQGTTTSATGTYSDHASVGGAASLTFTQPYNNLAPGSVVYSGFWVRLDQNTTSPATLVANAPVATGTNAANLAYNVFSIAPAATCNAASVGTGTLIASGTTLSAFTVGASVPLLAGTPPTIAGAPVQLCFQVTAGPALAQGQTASATWSFTATSN